MTQTADGTVEFIGADQDNTFGLHAMLAYSASVVLIMFLGSLLQRYNLNLGLAITEIVLIAIPAMIVLRAHRRTVNTAQFRLPTARQLLLTLLIAGCVAVFAVARGIAARKAMLGLDTGGVNPAKGMMLPLLVVLAPLCEELLFRPVVQNGLARHWGNRAAVIVTAVLFGLYHLDLLRFPETFILGVFAGIVFLKTGRYWCPVALHASCNAVGPLIWSHAPSLALLLHPAANFGLACLALGGCYLLGERRPMSLSGPLRRLNWAAFGTSQSPPRTLGRSRALVPVTGAVVLCLGGLLGYGYVLTVRLLARPNFECKYVVSEQDQWTVVSTEEIRACSTLTVQGWPETYEDLIVQLPFPGGAAREVKFGEVAVPFSRRKPGEYGVDLSSQQKADRSGPVTVIWTFSPSACLKRSDKGTYTAPLKSLAPSVAFSLMVTVEKDSGFRFSFGDRETGTVRGFNGSSQEVKMDYGSWGGLMRKGE